MTGEQLTLVEVKDAARELGIDLEGADLDFYHSAVLANVEVYAEIDALDDGPGLSFRGASRDWVEPADNPLGAWFVRTDIQTTSDGPLAGRFSNIRFTRVLSTIVYDKPFNARQGSGGGNDARNPSLSATRTRRRSAS